MHQEISPAPGPWKETTMKTTTIALSSAGLGLAALALVAAPAFAAGNGNGGGNGNGNHHGQGQGQGQGQCDGTGSGQGGQGMRGNGGTEIANLPMGELTDAQRATLASMAQEEKLAHDVYVKLGAQYPSATQFSRIVNAETRHLDAVRTLMSKYGIADPTAGEAEGTFTDPRFQDLYNQLVAGATTQEAALAAGVQVETVDIADLQKAQEGLTAPDVTQVYSNLLRASQHHLQAFGG